MLIIRCFIIPHRVAHKLYYAFLCVVTLFMDLLIQILNLNNGKPSSPTHGRPTATLNNELITRLLLLPTTDHPSPTPAGIVQSHKLGRVASLIGVEGGHSIGTSLGVLRMFYRLGVRYLTITHTCNTLWADCCLVDEPGRVPHIGGLSHFGTVTIVP